jgi:hypothetical protein
LRYEECLQNWGNANLSTEVQAFLAANPSIGTWGNTTLIRDILENQLHAKMELASTNNFHLKKGS